MQFSTCREKESQSPNEKIACFVTVGEPLMQSPTCREKGSQSSKAKIDSFVSIQEPQTHYLIWSAQRKGANDNRQNLLLSSVDKALRQTMTWREQDGEEDGCTLQAKSRNYSQMKRRSSRPMTCEEKDNQRLQAIRYSYVLLMSAISPGDECCWWAYKKCPKHPTSKRSCGRPWRLLEADVPWGNQDLQLLAKNNVHDTSRHQSGSSSKAQPSATEWVLYRENHNF